MALLQVRNSHFRRNALAATLAIMLAWQVEAQTPPANILQRWQLLNARAVEADRTGDYAKGIKLAEEALALSRKEFGDRDPYTLTSLNNLAALYRAQGRYREAEPLYREVLQTRREALGPRHPDTLKTQIDLAVLLINLDRREEAVRMLELMEPQLLGWIGSELYRTAAGAVRRQLLSSQTTFQDVVLSLATAHQSGEARRLAGTVMLRFKLLQGEEEAYLARLIRRAQDPRVQMLANDVHKLRTAVATAADNFGRLHAAVADAGGAVQAGPDAFDKVLQALEAKELALGEISGDYKDHLRVQTANLDAVQASLPPGTARIEFRQFRRLDFRTGDLGEPRFAGLLLAGFDEPVVADLGSVSGVRLPGGVLSDEVAAALYQKLFALFEPKLSDAKAIYIAPDGGLNLVPFAQLKLADGRYWVERQEVRLLQTGRDLLRPDPDRPAYGLLALGGVDFGAVVGKPTFADSIFTSPDHARAVARAVDALHSFPQLPASGDEANEVRDWYRRGRKNESAEVWSGADASKARLLALTSPPRVLHLATHGFYLPGEAPEPMVLSGIALAGANRELAGEGADGILFALEAQGLNLDGTELVVLSACDTAKGRLDYSEGVFGLARALRIAGAQNVLVTLWRLNDGEARDIMVAFYKTWPLQARSDPAKALREIQLEWLKKDATRDPRVWAPYVVVE
jgi:CHAT domain-containing protein